MPTRTGVSTRSGGASRTSALLTTPRVDRDPGGRNDDGSTLGPGFHERLSTFGKRSKGGVMPRAGRKTDWIPGYTAATREQHQMESADRHPQLYMPKSSLNTTRSAVIGGTPRFVENRNYGRRRGGGRGDALSESTPGPGHYHSEESSAARGALQSKSTGGVMPLSARSTNSGAAGTFKKGHKRPPIALAPAAHLWYHASDTPGPAAYEPLAPSDYRKKKLQQLQTPRRMPMDFQPLSRRKLVVEDQ